MRDRRLALILASCDRLADAFGLMAVGSNAGKLCIEVVPNSKLAWISEELCIGCGICVKASLSMARHVFERFTVLGS